VVQKLSEKEVRAGAIFAEDWGWYIPVLNEGFRLAIGCGINTETTTSFSVSRNPIALLLAICSKR
jgi:hypothetical protein